MVVSCPTWSIGKTSGSFESIHAVLPPCSAINCKSGAVVNLAGDLDVKESRPGGMWKSLVHRLFVNKSFFATTKIENRQESKGSIMMAPANPGGVLLHRLEGNDGEDLLIRRRAYVASDESVQISFGMQRGFGKLSKTGFLMLRASGQGIVACAAHGPINTFNLKPGEFQSFDNRRLVAWSGSARYRVGLARGEERGGIVKNEEGLMCFFEGPATIYTESLSDII